MFLPKYKFDDRLKIDREVDPPPATLFMGLGYDPNKDSKIRHYRKYYTDELENIEEVIPEKPFYEVEIKRGQSRGLKKSWVPFSSNKEDASG